MSSVVLFNSRSAWREAQPVSRTPAWSRIHLGSPRHCCGAGCCSFCPLQGYFSFMYLSAARQAPSAAPAWPATAMDACFPANAGVLASAITHERRGRREADPFLLLIFQSLLACSNVEEKKREREGIIKEIFCLCRKRRSIGSPRPDIQFSLTAGCLLVRHNKTLPKPAWELHTGGRPPAKSWMCLAIVQSWVIPFPTANSTTSRMHLSHPVPHHNTPKSGLLIFHPQPKHPESPGFTSTPREERMEMGQGKAAGLEVRGETLEKVCGQWWCLGEVSLAMAMMSHSPASGVSGATLTLHGLKEEVDPAIHHPHLFVGTDTELPKFDPEFPPQPGGEVRQKEGLGVLPLLLGLALEEQG